MPASQNLPHTEKSLVDFVVENHFSIFLLKPCADAARQWVENYIGSANGYQPYWPSVVVEHRYIAPILEGLKFDGLAVKENS
jgi:hypothetical protein